MKRRDFFASVVVAGVAGPAMAAQGQGHNHATVDGPLANATVSFGQWRQGQDRVAVTHRFPRQTRTGSFHTPRQSRPAGRSTSSSPACIRSSSMAPERLRRTSTSIRLRSSARSNSRTAEFSTADQR